MHEFVVAAVCMLACSFWGHLCALFGLFVLFLFKILLNTIGFEDVVSTAEHNLIKREPFDANIVVEAT